VPEAEYLWAYGVVPGPRAAPALPVGVEGRPVEAVWSGGLGVLASPVPSDRYSGAELQRRLEHFDTLEELARAHDHVLESALDAGDVIPFRMCTVFETPDAIRAMLESEGDRLRRTLAQLRGKTEWGVKAFARPRAAAAAAARPSSGTEYLTTRRAQREQAEAGSHALETAVAEIHTRLAQRASAAVVSRPQDRRLSGRDAEMLLNAAYLVPRDEAQDFAALVDDLGAGADDVELELTGPWPAYSFAAEAPR
jgi:hypothetical protein